MLAKLCLFNLFRLENEDQLLLLVPLSFKYDLKVRTDVPFALLLLILTLIVVLVAWFDYAEGLSMRSS